MKSTDKIVIHNIKLKGVASTRKVWLNGKELLPDKSQTFKNHSPDGFHLYHTGIYHYHRQ